MRAGDKNQGYVQKDYCGFVCTVSSGKSETATQWFKVTQKSHFTVLRAKRATFISNRKMSDDNFVFIICLDPRRKMGLKIKCR